MFEANAEIVNLHDSLLLVLCEMANWGLSVCLNSICLHSIIVLVESRVEILRPAANQLTVVELASVHVAHTIVHLLALVKRELAFAIRIFLLIFREVILEVLEVHLRLLCIFASKSTLYTHIGLNLKNE